MRRGILWAGLAGLVSVSMWVAPAAAACNVDTDCPTATCGGQVCQWSASGHSCVAAGTDALGMDGWCMTSADCKCMGEGATCQAASFHCTFTAPQDAGSSGDAEVGATSSSSSGGYASSSGGGGYSSGGSSSGGATTSSGGGSSSGEVLPDANVSSGQTTSSSSGGCAVSASRREGAGSAIALGSLAALAFVRRRRTTESPRA